MSAWLKGFKAYMQLERSMADHTVESYRHGAGVMLDVVSQEYDALPLEDIRVIHLTSFVAFVHDLGLAATSQARILSGIKSFFRYLLLEGIISADPTELLQSPKTQRVLPEVLSISD